MTLWFHMPMLFLTALVSPSTSAIAQDMPSPRMSIGQALGAVRHPLTVDSGGRLGGEGAAVLRDAIAPARFIAVGEDHFTREIPPFVSALCDLTSADLGALALEVGPRTLKLLEPALRASNREQRVRDFLGKYPNAIAFLDSADDNATAAHCARVSRSPRFRLIGADQEFLNATGVLLDRALATRLSPRARGALEVLQQRNREAEKKAAAGGDFTPLALLSWHDKDWKAAADAVSSGGNAEARGIIADLRESQAIYALNNSPTPQLSNERRAKLLKRNLLAALPPSGKVILKFGDWHLYKGFNPLHQRDLGNLVAEYADMHGEQSLHILVLGAKGVHATLTGYGKPPGKEPFVLSDDRDYHWFKAAADQQLADTWTLFDLRPLRFRRVDMDADWRRVVDGYDLMVVIPELTPAAFL